MNKETHQKIERHRGNDCRRPCGGQESHQRSKVNWASYGGNRNSEPAESYLQGGGCCMSRLRTLCLMRSDSNGGVSHHLTQYIMGLVKSNRIITKSNPRFIIRSVCQNENCALSDTQSIFVKLKLFSRGFFLGTLVVSELSTATPKSLSPASFRQMTNDNPVDAV